MTKPRWYVIGKNGVARPAESERQAILDAQDVDHFFPKYAPHRAVQLVESDFAEDVA